MEWKQILESVDDDYLVGISNKGIVKRAYKDRDEVGSVSEGVVEDCGTELKVSVGDETVNICNPVGESKCSCPSRSICRHIVLGILLAKEWLTDNVKETVTDNEKELVAEDADKPVADAGDRADSGNNAEASNLKTQLTDEIRVYPLKQLLKALGTKALRSLVENMQSGNQPDIQNSSIITVKLPAQQTVVKLLSPLEHSNCTCHKKELCSHKAEAILWCQWLNDVITTETLTAEMEQAPEYDREQIKEAAAQIREYLLELLHMGLCRTSMEVVNALERLAIVAHNAELPRLESELRTLADTYGRYLKRSATFSVEAAMGRVVRLYHQVSRLMVAESNSEISELAGEFHAEYKSVGNLDLIGITWEHFVSQSGYEGDTIYFLEENTKKWYTYTNARPTFYDGKRKFNSPQKAMAPWGLSVSLEAMVGLKIHLHGAKCDDTGRLSSSQDTKGEITDSRELSEELLDGWYYKDFGDAFSNIMTYDNVLQGQTTELTFLKPAEALEAKFDEVEQELKMPLLDSKGREVLATVRYSKKDAQTIRYLERMKESPPPCFLGRLYLKDGRMHMYPLDLFNKKEIPWSYEETDVADFGGDVGKDITNTPGSAADNATEKLEYANDEPQDAVLAILDEAEGALTDLYQVGFDTVQDAVLGRFKEVGETAESYGMEYLSKTLLELGETLAMKRHNIKKREDTAADAVVGKYATMCKYVFEGRKKVIYDKAKLYYGRKEE